MITVTDLLAPAGPVEKTLFPGEGDGSAGTPLETRLQTYIDQSNEKIADIAFVEPDRGAKAWALHLTFQAAYLVACSRPANENDMVPVLGSRGYAKDQRDALLAKAREYEAEFNYLVASVPTELPQRGYQSRQTTNVFDY